MPAARVQRFLIGTGHLPEFLPAGGEEISLCRIPLVFCHESEINAAPGDKEDHVECQQSVEIIGNGVQEELESVHRAALRNIGIDGSGPAGDRCDNADRRRRRINDIGELRPRHLVFVRHRAHHRANRQTVEIIVDKNQHAESGRRGQRLLPGFQMLRGPAPVGGRPAALAHQDDDHAEQHIKDDDVEIHAVRHGTEQRGKRQPRMRPRHHERADGDAAEQRQIDLLRDQCERDGDDRRKQ